MSTKGRYGLRALIDLAVHSQGGTPVSIMSISARQDLSERYLEQLMAMLKKAGIVRSIRGAGGGYVLARDTRDISVGDVLRALEGKLDPVDCAGLDPGGECRAADSCVTKYVWKRINESINRTVDEIRLDQLVAESRKKNPESVEEQL
nr:Rrf2 family transcriptional regulator [Mediterraneibacter glycyrrhizinilyticus]